ncbi:hypothetical protein BST96_18460 [Oceanicoccus sagamiensis]|uniref:Uncharacterized protein n=1 Tax=Oceanicoccus sagamiensis TaxID=716816 RepID=A0A1X9NL23_9GAMM|nr:hypothetical protein BST96_18460 [Oceanicoccus sagamiensis]
MKLYKNRSFRTIFLALFATLTFVGSAIFIFDVEARLMLQFLAVSLLGVVLMILAALAFTALRIAIRRWLDR